MLRRRVMKEMVTLVGIVVILAGLVFANTQLRRGTLKEKMEKTRRFHEDNRIQIGLDTLQWDLLRKTRGTYRSGPTFPEDLMPRKDSQVTVIGFMTPIDRFVQMSEFMLLPVPIQCYFCEIPPMRDVMLVQMKDGEEVPLIEEPVSITGRLILNEGPNTKFFYILADAGWEASVTGRNITKKLIAPEHRTPMHIQEGEQLLEGITPPGEQTQPPEGEAPSAAPPTGTEGTPSGN
ncbi:MAG: DUF3299 domain-containing protein [Candidatus Hydrogenedentes bacterium]|nr:DUF3299 domain-containing protein [Candidatus Hydrogenedentota bacterium]